MCEKINIDRNRFFNLLNEGKTATELAEYFNCNMKLIYDLTRKYKIKLYRCLWCGTKQNLFKYYRKEKEIITNSCIECRTDRSRQTCLKKYGVINAGKNEIIKEKMRNTCLERYGIEYSCQSEIVIGKRKNTCMKKYNTECVLSLEDNVNKRKNTCIEKYGVDNPAKAEIIKKKMRSTCLDRYGVEYSGQANSVKEKIKKTFLKKYGSTSYFSSEQGRKKKLSMYSKISQDLFWNIYYKIIEGDRKSIFFGELNREKYLSFPKSLRKSSNINNKGFYYDFCMEDLKIILEFNGVYWHKCPELVSYEDLTDIEYLEIEKIWHRDHIKRVWAQDNGFTFIEVWEHMYRKNKDKILNWILEIIVRKKECLSKGQKIEDLNNHISLAPLDFI